VTAWRVATLGDEIELAYGKSLPERSRIEGPVGVYGSNGAVGSHTEPYVSGPGIIVGRKGSVGEVAYSSGEFWPIDTTYYVVQKNDHNWRFLYHLLRFCDLTGLNSHSTIPGLNREDAYKIQVSLPDRAVEDQLAAALDWIEGAARKESDAMVRTGQLKAVAMRQLFSQGLRGEAQRETEVGPVPESWGVAAIDEHFSVVSGGTPSRSNATYWSGGTIPWVKTTEVNYSMITETEEHITQAGLNESAAKLLPPGTLLMAMYGQGVTRGKVGILGIQASCNQACAAMTPTDDEVAPRYLYHYLTSQYEAIRSLAHGGQQQNLNLDIVRKIDVAVPPTIDEQQEIVDVLDAVDRKIDLHRRKRAVLDQLFKSLLHKLMTGEISVDDLDLSALPSIDGSAA
jgi:type I restriction enzyme S subunit